MTTLSLRPSAALQAGETTPLDLVNDHLSRFEEKNPTIGALISYDADLARADAEQADLSKPLGGIPIVLKDNINALGQPCTCASKFLASGYTAPYDATVTRKLREAGRHPDRARQHGRIRDGLRHRKLRSCQHRQSP